MTIDKCESTDQLNSKWDVIDNIVALELEMFLNVRARADDGNSKCLEEPGTFKMMRWMSHSVLSQDTLESYLCDLLKAKVDDRNLMTEKYALMENIIPHTNNNSVINKIADIEVSWMKELKIKFPNLMNDNAATFRNYMVCEYETYSDQTLDLLMADINKALAKELNLPEIRYKNLFKRLGYKSIEEAAKANSLK